TSPLPPSIGTVSPLPDNPPTPQPDGTGSGRDGPLPRRGLRLLPGHPHHVLAGRFARPPRLVDVRGRHRETHPEAREEFAPARRRGTEDELHRAASTRFGASRQPSINSK